VHGVIQDRYVHPCNHRRGVRCQLEWGISSLQSRRYSLCRKANNSGQRHWCSAA